MRFLAATVLYALSAVLYYRGRFALAGATGAAFGAVAGWILATALAPVPACLAILLLFVAPAACLVVHVVDARRGLFILPTIYAIPLAFACGLVLWAVAGLAFAW